MTLYSHPPWTYAFGQIPLILTPSIDTLNVGPYDVAVLQLGHQPLWSTFRFGSQLNEFKIYSFIVAEFWDVIDIVLCKLNSIPAYCNCRILSFSMLTVFRNSQFSQLSFQFIFNYTLCLPDRTFFCSSVWLQPCFQAILSDRSEFVLTHWFSEQKSIYAALNTAVQDYTALETVDRSVYKPIQKKRWKVINYFWGFQLSKCKPTDVGFFLWLAIHFIYLIYSISTIWIC